MREPLDALGIERATLPWESEKRLYEAGVTAVFLWPKERIRVSVFGGIVVLRGTVGLAQTRKALHTFVAIQPGVERVVNNLTVRRVSGRSDSR